jgi:hypothetical protein
VRVPERALALELVPALEPVRVQELALVLALVLVPHKLPPCCPLAPPP